MKLNWIYKWAMVCVLLLPFAACNDLDLEPYNEVTSIQVYEDFGNYKNVLAKLYGGLAVSGQQGPAGDPDISGLDEGASTYIRAYWKLQELPTDEAIIAWNDEGLPTLNTMQWSSDNGFVAAMYYRIFYQISLANEFIRETSDDKLAARGIVDADLETTRLYRAEARFLRALSYYHALDMFGNVPFVTEEDGVGAYFPEQTNRADLFAYVESELLDILPNLVDARQNEYARADKAAAWMLLAKLYLNAEVYIGEDRYTDAITYLNQVIGSGYSLEPNYNHLFLADNHLSEELIFPVAFDGVNTTSFGGTTFLVNAAVGGTMDREEFGIPGGWQGLRTRPEVVQLYPGTDGSPDARGLFHTEEQNLDIEDVAIFQDGYAVIKYKNVTREGQRGSSPGNDQVDTDFPLFRLADAYLMYAEAVLRGGSGGGEAQALAYINELRERAYGDASGNITAGQLNLDFILDERARELKWEGHRRTDLVRFGRFTSADYIWQWKGGTFEGNAVEDYRDLYPLPAADLTANPRLEQNEGY
ncbi:RagB/SusD family nutrient uptake outer membrane protein [Echinicola jeungdonensis]|uniref:RagB/SusD family nutrient uptake outer membrane protein n=1 Tax=Echinicola jeungdonensis TaxID=709343 RepID=A0ABV5J4D4_9BACT|nr:RagB/SusD family nutrient uptake outer membrane protein [Echinicola jeungdonensis]MDN3667905.1 RagB/SusD family nutrient uptake outer membrane protein [Echinicola jeungdonensis]